METYADLQSLLAKLRGQVVDFRLAVERQQGALQSEQDESEEQAASHDENGTEAEQVDNQSDIDELADDLLEIDNVLDSLDNLNVGVKG